MQYVSLVLAAALAFPLAAHAAQPTLTDQRGTQFSLADLRGSDVVVTFISARCTDACPLIDAQVARAAHDPRSRAYNIRYLTVTLDPEHDTRTDMARINREFGADPTRWILATGKVSAVHAVMRDFHVVGNAKIHTTFVYILDAGGRERAAFLASSNLAEQIFEMFR